jgi:ABC-2 type transport system permease protein
MKALLLKEIRSLLSSLIGYVAIAMFLLVNGLYLWIFETEFNILNNGFASIDAFFIISPWVLTFLIPAITMRTFAEEKRSGTIELLLTKPITEIEIILAKYFASLLVVVIAILPTSIYYFTVYYLGDPVGNIDLGGTLGSYVGLLLFSAAYVSIGLFGSAIVSIGALASSDSNHQLVSFAGTAFPCLFMYTGFSSIASFELFGSADNIIVNLGMQIHYNSLSLGLIDSRDVVYFAALIIIFLLLTKTVLSSRKW